LNIQPIVSKKIYLTKYIKKNSKVRNKIWPIEKGLKWLNKGKWYENRLPSAKRNNKQRERELIKTNVNVGKLNTLSNK
jgi:hypothetical protein